MCGFCPADMLVDTTSCLCSPDVARSSLQLKLTCPQTAAGTVNAEAPQAPAADETD